MSCIKSFWKRFRVICVSFLELANQENIYANPMPTYNRMYLRENKGIGIDIPMVSFFARKFSMGRHKLHHLFDISGPVYQYSNTNN